MEEVRTLIIFCDSNEKIITKLQNIREWSLEDATDDHGGYDLKLTKSESAFFLNEYPKKQNIVIASCNEDSDYKNTNSNLEDLSFELKELNISNHILASQDDLS